MRAIPDGEAAIQMLVDQDDATCKRYSQWCLLQLPDVIGELDRVVFGNGSLVLDGEHSIQIVMLDGHERGSRFGRCDGELAVEFGNVGVV